jgi:WD40 repeat protein
MWLGQIEADLVESSLRPVRDRSLTAHLQAIADRLLKTLPPSKIQFQVTLIDSDDINGFSVAGGHIYILRKLAAVAQSDDELAGVIGHEIGHIVSHQFAFETTREMKRLLGVTGVGDETDLRKKYEEMLDAEYKDKHPQLGENDRDQAEADQIAVYAMKAAGYRPEAYGEFWNRVFFVQGKTGSRLGDLLGFTKPSQKRLRSIGAMVAALPPACGSGALPERQEFAPWHAAVVANQAGTELARSTALKEIVLNPPLRLELDQIRFSPDGGSMLAQDESSIFVLTPKPLALRYRIDASGALPAQFSPDSKSIVFNTWGLHIEQWSTAEKKLIAAREMLTKSPCYDIRLSPDGRTLICVGLDTNTYELTLSMMDTNTSEILWQKKDWLMPSPGLLYSLLTSREPVFLSSYSPDGNTLLFAGGDAKLAFDLKQRSVLKTGGPIRSSITGSYAFLGNDKVVAVNRENLKDSAIYSFPDGRKLQKTALPFPEFKAVSNPGPNSHVLFYGMKDYAIALYDLGSQKVLMAEKTAALDEYDGTVAGESQGGTLVTVPLNNLTAQAEAKVELPTSPLPFSPVAALSPSGRYLALSTRRRGGIWDLTTGRRIAILAGFTDAAWGDAATVFLDTAKDGNVERHIEQISTATMSAKKLTYKLDDETHMRYGRLTDWKLDERKKNWTLSVYDPATDKAVWSRSFPDRYFSYTSSYGNLDLIFSFELNSHVAKEALKTNPALQAEVQAIKDKASARLIQVLDGTTGEDRGMLVVELPPNYAGTNGLNRSGDLLYAEGVDDRTAVYEVSTGKKVRNLIGYVRAVDTATGRVFTANRVGEGVVYDAAGGELSHYQLGDPIRYALFRDQARVVTVLTADQKVRTMQVGPDAATQNIKGKAESVAAK